MVPSYSCVSVRTLSVYFLGGAFLSSGEERTKRGLVPSFLMSTCISSSIFVKLLEIRWHSSVATHHNEGISAIDVHPTLLRVVTAGYDGTAKLWELHPSAITALTKDDTADISEACTFIAVLKDIADSPAVNCARFSPAGCMVATCHEDGETKIWRRSMDSLPIDAEDDRIFNKESWACPWHLRQANAVYAIAWSPDSKYMMTGSHTGDVTFYCVEDQTARFVFHEQHDFAQGVVWDPWYRFAASFGSEGTVQYYSVECAIPLGNSNNAEQQQHQQQKRRRGISIYPSCVAGKQKSVCRFRGKYAKQNFRRLSASPDGMLLAVPCGYRTEATPTSASGPENRTGNFCNCVHLFMRNSLTTPFASLGVAGEQTVLGVRFAPFLLQPLDEDADPVHLDAKGSWGPAEYRIVLSVWTETEVVLYTSDSAARHSSYSNLHLREITDVGWSCDGRYMLIASEDGYVSLVSFERCPIGTLVPPLSTVGLAENSILQSVTSVLSSVAQSAGEFETRVTAVGSNKVTKVAVKKKRRIEGGSESAKPEEAAIPLDADALGSLL